MKKLIGLLLCITSFSTFANCIDLSGSYYASPESCNGQSSADHSYAGIWNLAKVEVGTTFKVEQLNCETIKITSDTGSLRWDGAWNEGSREQIIIKQTIGKEGLKVTGNNEIWSFPFDAIKTSFSRSLTLDKKGNLIAKWKRGRITSTGETCVFSRE